MRFRRLKETENNFDKSFFQIFFSQNNLDFHQLRICKSPRPLPPSKVAIFSRKISTVLNWMKNIFSDFFLGLWLIVFTIYGDTPIVPPTKKKMFKNSHIHKKDAQWAKAIEKLIFRFLVFDMVDFVPKFFYVRGYALPSHPFLWGAASATPLCPACFRIEGTRSH